MSLLTLSSSLLKILDNRQIMKYEEAIKELETIVSQIERNELDIDQLTERLKVAQELIKQCRDKLYKTDEEIKAMLEE